MHRNALYPALALVAISCAACSPTLAQEATELWRLDGFAAPESVTYDPGTGTLFVSNLAVDMSAPRPAPTGDTPPSPEAPKGYVSQVSLDGEILVERFVDNLAAPGGNTIVDGVLWQLAGDLLKIEIETATILETYARPAEVKGLLPDVAIAADGSAYVTSMAGVIYLAQDGTLVPWLEDGALGRANGIIIVGNEMIIAAGTAIKVVDIETKQIKDYGAATPLETLDDLRMIPTGMLVSSGGKVVEVTPDGAAEVIVPLDGVAGIGYAENENLVVVTRLAGNEVIAYNIKF